MFVADPATKTVSIREIKVDRSNGADIEVVSGLKLGEQVVTSGALFIDRALQGD